MLRSLRISDLAVIEELEIGFGPGLNVVTGETGAGKSLLQRALAASVGHRLGGEVVRTGRSTARIEVEVDLADAPAAQERLDALGLNGSSPLRVKRTVARTGRGEVRIDGSEATLATLKQIGELLVHVQGQHESLLLLDPESHVALLDRASGSERAVAAFGAAFAELREAIARVEEIERDSGERERRLAVARFDLDELSAARIQDPDEIESLTQERSRLRNLERLSGAANDALERLHGGEAAALAGVEEASRRLAASAELDSGLAAAVALLDEAAAPLAEAVRELEHYVAGLEDAPGRVDEIEDRLALLARLMRKHAAENLAALVARRESLEEEIERASGGGADPEALRADLDLAADRAWKLAHDLASTRAKGAERLVAQMEEELAALGMSGARLLVHREPLPAGPARGAVAALTRSGVGLGPEGMEQIEFYLAANAGEEALPLARVASGGELSRVMLALFYLTGGSTVPTLVFDEVDAGIGGAAAEAVGRRLHAIARGSQVICVTHLAQIAAFADRHYAVEKKRRQGRTVSRAQLIEGEERVGELARMIGGADPGEDGHRHASAMLRRARAALDSEAERPATRPARARAAQRGA